MKLFLEGKKFLYICADSSGFDGQSMIRFNLDMILIATNEFSLENKLGQGGFGSVYKVRPLEKSLISIFRWVSDDLTECESFSGYFTVRERDSCKKVS